MTLYTENNGSETAGWKVNYGYRNIIGCIIHVVIKSAHSTFGHAPNDVGFSRDSL